MIPFSEYFVQKAYAAAPPQILPVGQPNAGTTDPNTVINSLYTSVFGILTLAAALLAFIYLVWSGVQYITAGGNADKAKAGRAGVINAVIGIVIIVAAYAIVRVAISIGTQINTAI